MPLLCKPKYLSSLAIPISVNKAVQKSLLYIPKEYNKMIYDTEVLLRRIEEKAARLEGASFSYISRDELSCLIQRIREVVANRETKVQVTTFISLSDDRMIVAEGSSLKATYSSS